MNIEKYCQVGVQIRSLFKEYTDLVEPLFLDEAYLDVSNCLVHGGSPTLMARDVRKRIWQQHFITASAEVVSNKFLAKVFSGW